MKTYNTRYRAPASGRRTRHHPYGDPLVNITRHINSHRSPSSRRGGALQGCLIALGVVLLLVIVGGVLVAMNWKSLAAGASSKMMEAAIDSAPLPESEKPELKTIVNGVIARFESGDITLEQLGEVGVAVAEGKAIAMGAAYVADSAYIQSSALSDEEKADGALQMKRIAQGLHDGAVDRDAYWAVFEPLTIPGNDPDSFELKEPSNTTPEDIRELIALATTLADDAGVTAEPVMIDLSDALQAEVDAALGEATHTHDHDGHDGHDHDHGAGDHDADGHHGDDDTDAG